MPRRQPSTRTLDETPLRAFVLLHGISIDDAIRAVLMEQGFRAEDHAEGWALLGRVCAFRPARSRDQRPVRALAELADWHKKTLPRMRIALARQHPDACRLVFGSAALGDLTRAGPSDPVAATIEIAVMLDKLDSLEKGESRPAGDRAALEALARRGLTPAERARLGELVRTAQTQPRTAAKSTDVAIVAADQRALRAWYIEWGETARLVLPRRDHRERLGLIRHGASVARRAVKR